MELLALIIVLIILGAYLRANPAGRVARNYRPYRGEDASAHVSHGRRLRWQDETVSFLDADPGRTSMQDIGESSAWTDHATYADTPINPASGLPMVAGLMGGVDVAGNAWGESSSTGSFGDSLFQDTFHSGTFGHSDFSSMDSISSSNDMSSWDSFGGSSSSSWD